MKTCAITQLKPKRVCNFSLMKQISISKRLQFFEFFSCKDYTLNYDDRIQPFSKIEEKLKNSSIQLLNGISSSLINSECKSKQNVAFIIPYRDRLNNLLIFLNNMHVYLTNQKITYGFFLVEPKIDLNFNRGILMNIGYLEAIKLGKENNLTWDCFIFHGKFFRIVCKLSRQLCLIFS